MITRTTQPPAISLAGNPITFEFSTDNRFSGNAGVAAAVSFELTGSGTYDIVLTTSSGDQITIPIDSAQSFDPQFEEVQAFQQNYEMSTSNGVSTITAKLPGTEYTLVAIAIINGTAYVTEPEITAGEDPEIRPFFRILCKLFRKNTNGSATLLGSDYLTPDDENKVLWDVSDYFKRELRTNFDIKGQSLTLEQSNGICEYYVTAEETAAEGLSDTPQSWTGFYALFGGISYMQLAYFNQEDVSWYTEYEAAAFKPFLSWAPASKTIDTAQREKLHYLHIDQDKNLTRVVQMRYTDDSTGAVSLPFSAKQNVVHSFAVGYTELALQQQAKTVASYQIWIEDNGTVISEKRTYVLDYAYYNTVRYLYFANSFGAWETLRLTGAKTDVNQYTRQHARYILQHNFSFYSQSIETDIRQNRKVQANAGFVSADEKQYLSELMLSRKVLEEKDGVFRIVLVDSTELADDSEQFLKDFSVSYTDAHSDKYHTELHTYASFGAFDQFFDVYFD